MGDEGFNALGVVGRAGSGVGPGVAGAAGPGLPSAPAGPTASSSRSRVVRCTLPLDVGAVGRLHTYARLRALVLVGPGPAAALLEVLRPLTGEGGREGGRGRLPGVCPVPHVGGTVRHYRYWCGGKEACASMLL